MSTAGDDAFDRSSPSGTLIASYRRSPSHCLYCPKPASTREHALPEALGGRLWARVLCPHHNGEVNRLADEALNSNFAPLVNMLQVRRQRGTVGAQFTAFDEAGKPITILPEGFAKQKPLEVIAKADDGRIVHAVGDLAQLDRLPPEAMSTSGRNPVLATISNSIARFEIRMNESFGGAILKIALHFFASFVDDVKPEVANSLLPYIVGAAPAEDVYVRQPFLDPDAFPDAWPPRHEVACYPDGELTLVSILLFSTFAFTCRLPISMPSSSGIRYVQYLASTDPFFQVEIARPATLTWDDYPSLYEPAIFAAPLQRRISRIHHFGMEQAVRARCRRAAQNANAMSANYGDIWERYATQLSLECFTAEEIHSLVLIGQRLEREGKDPWEVPLAPEDTA